MLPPMQKTDTLPLAPGECTTCARAEGPFVDTLRDNHAGRIYVCQLCVMGMAQILDLDRSIRAERDGATRAAAKALERAQDAEGRFDELQKAVVLTLQQGAVTRHGTIALRKRRA